MTYTVHVAIEIYSGREDPSWDLTPPQAAEFRARLADLQLYIAEPVSAADGLGYRGVQVAVRSNGASQSFLVVSQRLTPQPSTLESRTLRDPARALEKWLIETGSTQLEPALLQYLRQEAAR